MLCLVLFFFLNKYIGEPVRFFLYLSIYLSVCARARWQSHTGSHVIQLNTLYAVLRKAKLNIMNFYIT